MPGGGASPYVGQIAMVGFTFAPRDWAFCDGQLMSIDVYTDLFVVIGTTYGGDGQTTFGLPDLRGRVPIGAGQGVGLSPYVLGQLTGVESVALSSSQLPSHQHASNPGASKDEPTSDRPDNGYPTVGGYYASTTNSTSPMGTSTVSATGGGLPHANLQPYLGINFVIALIGQYPAHA